MHSFVTTDQTLVYKSLSFVFTLTYKVHVTHSLNNSFCAVEERWCISSWRPPWHDRAVCCVWFLMRVSFQLRVHLEFFFIMSTRVSDKVWCISTSNSHSSSACYLLTLARGKFGRCLDKLMAYQAESCCY